MATPTGKHSALSGHNRGIMDIDPEAVCFRINNEIVHLYPPTNDAREQFRDDHAFAISSIQELVNSQQISLHEPITRIAILDNNSEKVIYVNEQILDSDTENMEPNIDDSQIRQNSYTPCDSAAGSSQSNDERTNGFGDKETRFILDKYSEYMDQIGPMKTFKTKKVMWGRIVQEYFAKFRILKTEQRIENRFKTILRRKKDAVINNSKSGRSRKEVPFEEELQKITAKDDSIEPELIRRAKKLEVLKKSRTPPVDSDSLSEHEDEDDMLDKKIKKLKKLRGEMSKKRTRHQSAAELIRSLHMEKEKAKQERHVEKLQLMRELFGKKQNE